MAQDGTFVAGCEALINAPCLEADVERVCTHSGFRKRGFALYGSMGAVDEVKSFNYGRQMNPFGQ